ncbi:MAG: M48 family metallopeptidase [Myxococcota bacterium]
MQPGNQQEGFDTSGGRMVKEIIIIVAVLIVVVGAALWLVSKAAGWAVGLVPTSVDTTIGETAASAYTDESKLCDHSSINSYVEALTKPLLVEFGPQPYEFSFKVIEEDVPNAFALPGGFVTIHSGLIESAESGEEIAGVLAHEIAHVTHRHGVRRIVRSAGIAIAVGLIFGSTDLAVLADYASDLGSLAYDRDQEREADETAREILTKAGINPRGMATFFKKLLKEEDSSSGWFPEFLSTHPDLAERVEESLAAPLPEGKLMKLPPPMNLKCKGEEQ